MEFDSLTVALLSIRADYVDPGGNGALALQDAHLAYLASLHATGALLAAGPLDDGPYVGLSILSVGVEEAARLKAADPAVQAGRFQVTVMPWLVPAGAAHFTPTFFPSSVADVRG